MLLKKAAGIEKGSGSRTRTRSARSRASSSRRSRRSRPDLNAADLDAAVRIIAGSARSMGLEVEGVVMAKVTKARKAASREMKPGKAYPLDDALKLVKEFANASSTSPSTSRSTSASTPRSPTSTSAARPCCRTATARR